MDIFKVVVILILTIFLLTICILFFTKSVKIIQSKNNMQNRLFLSYLFFLIIIISFITFVTYNITRNIIIDNVGQSRAEVLSRTADNINSLTYSITLAVSLHSFNDELDKILSRPLSDDPYDRLLERRKTNEMFDFYLDAFEKLDLSYYTVIYGYNKFFFTNIETPLEKFNYDILVKCSWYKDVIENNGKILWVSTHNDKNFLNKDRNVFTAARLLKHLKTNKPLGVLYLNVDESVLYNTYKKSLDQTNEIYILDNLNRIVSSEYKSKLGKAIDFPFNNKNYIKKGNNNFYIQEVEDREYLVSYNILDQTGWKIVEITSLKSLLAPIHQKMKWFFWLLILCIILSTFFSYLIAKKITAPINVLSRTMQTVGTGDLTVRFNYPGSLSNEIKELGKGFNDMIDEINQLISSVKREEKLKSEAEVKYLQTQINPHFLYNTLNSIRCLIVMDKKKEAEAIMKKLISFLREMLNLNEKITVADEFNNMEDYISIEKYKYGDFSVSFYIQDDLYSAYIPKMILQPIVENAIFHGLGQKNEKGIIRIEALKDNDNLLIKVIDNGVGIQEDKLLEINNTLDDSNQGSSEHIGLANVHQRIIFKYGVGYGLKIKSQISVGTEVEQRLPLTYTQMGGL